MFFRHSPQYDRTCCRLVVHKYDKIYFRSGVRTCKEVFYVLRYCRTQIHIDTKLPYILLSEKNVFVTPILGGFDGVLPERFFHASPPFLASFPIPLHSPLPIPYPRDPTCNFLLHDPLRPRKRLLQQQRPQQQEGRGTLFIAAAEADLDPQVFNRKVLSALLYSLIE